MSGLISNDISAALKKDAEDSARPHRPTGEYEVEVTSVAIADNPTTWIEKALMVEAKFLDDLGGTQKVRIELAPCTAKDGSLSTGKIKFLRWQLGALGLDPDEIAFQLFGIIGNHYKAKYTADDGLDANGEPRPERKDRNPHTGKPYINKDLVFNSKIETPEAKQDADAEAPDAEAADEGDS